MRFGPFVIVLFISIGAIMPAFGQGGRTPKDLPARYSADTIKVNVFSFEDPSPTGWAVPYRGKAVFPDSATSFRQILMVQHLKCDPRTNHDTFPCGEWDYHTQYLIKVPENDSIEVFELASFITPYGIRLNMGGEKGWKWVYDITDYAPLLHGEREIVAGNNQELLDLSFLFIKGTPARKSIDVRNVYPTGHFKYWQLADDSVLKEVKIPLLPEARQFMIKARISGHGHEGPLNCCEWDRKVHAYRVNGDDLFRWEVWKDCGFNPIYPQGGTWPFDRAGWCPGTPVDEYTFELGQIARGGDTLRIDYGIEAYRETGEKQGEFRMSHQLFSFSDPSFNLDAEVYDIISPSNTDAYSRVNPSDGSAIIIIRNAGKYDVKSLRIKYGIIGGPGRIYEWSGNLPFMNKIEIGLPFANLQEYEGRGFYVELLSANGVQDDYIVNNYMTSIVPLYPNLPSKFSISLHTNNLGRASELSLKLVDCSGITLLDSASFLDDSTYLFDLSLAEGCYELLLTDKRQDGMMRHWWNRRSEPEKVGISGTLKILDQKGAILKEFPADFGEKLLYRFQIDD